MLAGCGVRQAEKVPGAEIACALAGSNEFRPECSVERSRGADGVVLTLHHADGGFRRLLVMKDGQGAVAADGAEPAEVRKSGTSEIEVSIGGDRYRLPAKPEPANP